MNYGQPSSGIPQMAGQGYQSAAGGNQGQTQVGAKPTFTADQDQIILQGKKLGKAWSEIAAEAGCTETVPVLDRYNYLTNGGQPGSSSSSSSVPQHAQQSQLAGILPHSQQQQPAAPAGMGQQTGPIADIAYWDNDDIETLRDLLEHGERAKWKYISSELTRERNKRIPAVACQKKFKDMFGVAEASSALGSSLCYVVAPNGWACLEDSNAAPGVRPATDAGSGMHSNGSGGLGRPSSLTTTNIFDYQSQYQTPQQPPQQQTPQQQAHQGYGPMTTAGGFIMGNVNKKPAITSPQGRPVDRSREIIERLNSNQN